MSIKNFVYALFLMFSTTLFSQTEENEHEPHHDDSHNHHEIHHNFEIGVSNSLIYFINEKEYAYGTHLHLAYNIPNTKFGIGLGFEKIFDEHKHQTIGILGSYRPFEGLNFTLSPALSFEGNDTSDINFAIHFETGYEFELQNFHLGPVIGIAYEPEDYHLSLGIHIAYGF